MGLTSKRRSILIVIGAAVILIVMGMLLSNVSGKKTHFRASDHLNTIWTSDKICLWVDNDANCFGVLQTGTELLNIQFLFGKGLDNGVTIEDYNAKQNENYEFNAERYLVLGNYELTEFTLRIEVVKSKVANIQSGDRIELNRVDTLPDWAEVKNFINNTGSEGGWT